MIWAYLLESVNDKQTRYIGMTKDLDRRLKEHNSGIGGEYTSKYGPWKIVLAMRFDNGDRAARFERYLKSGSGHAFARRHFW